LRTGKRAGEKRRNCDPETDLIHDKKLPAISIRSVILSYHI
jgi:hypothetical protein